MLRNRHFLLEEGGHPISPRARAAQTAAKSSTWLARRRAMGVVRAAHFGALALFLFVIRCLLIVAASLFFLPRGVCTRLYVKKVQARKGSSMQLEIGECFESINDALLACVTALGGFKKVGPQLRPELPIDQAAGWLRDCLNASRREKLAPEQVVLILRLARVAGYHATMQFLAFDTGYKAPLPVDPESQEAELQEQFIQAVGVLDRIQGQLQRMQRVRGVA